MIPKQIKLAVFPRTSGMMHRKKDTMLFDLGLMATHQTVRYVIFPSSVTEDVGRAESNQLRT